MDAYSETGTGSRRLRAMVNGRISKYFEKDKALERRFKKL
jgi:ATP-dependent Clp protease ATP-binding subunit ClpA